MKFICKLCAAAAARRYADPGAKKARRVVDREWCHSYVADYLRTHPCEVCGLDDPAFLEFDHVSQDDKVAPISTLAGTGRKKAMLLELEKCRVLCGSCHNLVSAKQRNSWRYVAYASRRATDAITQAMSFNVFTFP